MEVILLEKIANLGNLGDKVNVRAGYGRNFLVPQGKAVPATADKVAEFETRRAELEKKAVGELATAQARAEQIGKLDITIARKAGDEGKLFGSVGTLNIAESVVEAGVSLNKSEIRLPDGALRNTGDFEISIQLHSDVVCTLRVKIVAESD